MSPLREAIDLSLVAAADITRPYSFTNLESGKRTPPSPERVERTERAIRRFLMGIPPDVTLGQVLKMMDAK